LDTTAAPFLVVLLKPLVLVSTFTMLDNLRAVTGALLHVIHFLFNFLTGSYFQSMQSLPTTSRIMRNIVIIGGSYAGISTAHRILKHAAKSGHFKITLVSPNTHFYWNIASPRGLIPGQFSDDQLFQPIAAGFSQYPDDQFEFVLAFAEALDFTAKTVRISGHTGQNTLSYDFLILATGSHTKGDAPFKGKGSTEATKEALHTFQARVKRAKSIVVAGAGVTGTEFAGELGFEYGQQKDITLVSLRIFWN
jgi:uncharacterized NAD(P)/FAD-binding protein YdhS